MVIVFCPLCQRDIINDMENFEIEGSKVFSFNKKEGMRLTFDSTIEDEYEACKVAKKVMGSFKYASGLNYYVAPYDGKEVKWI